MSANPNFYEPTPEPTPEPAPPAAPRRDVVQIDTSSPAFGIGRVIYVLLGVVVALIILRVALKALMANTGASFTSFVYGITDPLVAPFHGIFNTPHTNYGGLLELSSMVAIVVYAILAWAIVRLASLAGRRRTTTSY